MAWKYRLKNNIVSQISNQNTKRVKKMAIQARFRIVLLSTACKEHTKNTNLGDKHNFTNRCQTTNKFDLKCINPLTSHCFPHISHRKKRLASREKRQSRVTSRAHFHREFMGLTWKSNKRNNTQTLFHKLICNQINDTYGTLKSQAKVDKGTSRNSTKQKDHITRKLMFTKKKWFFTNFLINPNQQIKW